jgi:hypothetical protein
MASKLYIVVYKKKDQPGTSHYTYIADHKDDARRQFLEMRIPHDHIIKVIR